MSYAKLNINYTSVQTNGRIRGDVQLQSQPKTYQTDIKKNVEENIPQKNTFSRATEQHMFSDRNQRQTPVFTIQDKNNKMKQNCGCNKRKDKYKKI